MEYLTKEDLERMRIEGSGSVHVYDINPMHVAAFVGAIKLPFALGIVVHDRGAEPFDDGFTTKERYWKLQEMLTGQATRSFD